MLPIIALVGVAASRYPHLVQIVADDLGYNDLGHFNGNKTTTPNLDAHLKSGVFLSNFYAWRVCAPSRASAMSGRYNWGVGFYDMSDDTHHCIEPRFKLLPAALKEQAGYATHAIGKWDVGWIEQHCTPTFRGFDSFLGYYTACTSDYWYHGAPGGNLTFDKCRGVDFHDSLPNEIRGAKMSGPDSLNNTYDQEVFTRRAVAIIDRHGQEEAAAAVSPPLFLYLAYHNVHDACEADRFTRGLHAPLSTVERYSTTILDTWKVQAAMTTELDYGVGNVTAALKRNGMWNKTLLMFWSDNGGPLDHSSNWPLRAGKGSQFEGGYRVVAFISSGGLLPREAAGTTFEGIGHVSDWYTSLLSTDGVVGCGLPRDTGPRPPDGVNLWPALVGRNRTAPRREVVLSVTNRYFQSSPLCPAGCPSAIRVEDLKLIINASCTDRPVWQKWPSPGSQPVPFGRSGGTVEHGTDHARAPLLGHIHDDADDEEADGRESTQTGTGKWDQQQAEKICLYNLTADPGERENLAKHPAYARKLAELRSILAARAATGPPVEIAYTDVGMVNRSTDNAVCEQEQAAGYLEPVDWTDPPSGGRGHV